MVIRKIIMLQVFCSQSGNFRPSNAQDGAYSVLSFVLMVATGILSEGGNGLKVGIVSDTTVVSHIAIVSDTGIEPNVAIGTNEPSL
jgi:hypothetical protein